MLDKLFFGSRLHEHADPAQRVLGTGALAPDSPVLAEMLVRDPSAEVRTAAAARCGNPAALLAALKTEREPPVRAALAVTLGSVLATLPEASAARAVLDAPGCTDEARAELVLRTQDDERRRAAIGAIGDEDALVASRSARSTPRFAPPRPSACTHPSRCVAC